MSDAIRQLIINADDLVRTLEINLGIEKALREKGFIDFEINLPQSLKSLGDHKIEISFKRGIRGEAVIFLRPEK